MKKTVLITGSSSGIGRAAVVAFAAAGWNVAATMRTPGKETELNKLAGVRLYALDVTKPDNVHRTLAEVTKEFGRLDVVVNNAGYGVDGAFEAMSDEIIAAQFETNVFGLMRVTREAIRLMREQGGGTLVQIASMGGRITFPAFSIYHGTKWAVEGLSESLQYELAPHNIRMKIVEPGPIKTDFYGRSRKFVRPDYTDAYNGFLDNCETVAADAGAKADPPEKVARVILRAATDESRRLRYVVGNPAPLLLWLRKLLPESWFYGIVRASYKI